MSSEFQDLKVIDHCRIRMLDLNMKSQTVVHHHHQDRDESVYSEVVRNGGERTV